MKKFYTSTGDDGLTSQLSGGRTIKSDEKIEALGSVDEVTSVLGFARSLCQASDIREILLHVQRDLYPLMSEISAAPEHAERFRQIGEAHVKWLEEQTDSISHLVEIPNDFIIPGDSPAGAALDMTRTVVRRAERRLVAFQRKGMLANGNILSYFNRLSSLCFMLELYEYKIAGVNELTLVNKKGNE